VVPLEHIEPAHRFHGYLKEKVPGPQKYKLDVGGEICDDGDKQSINVAPGLDMVPGLDNLLNQHHLVYATAVAQNAQEEEEDEDEKPDQPDQPESDKDEDGHVCRKCYRKVMGVVMEKAVEITRGMCEKTKCPAMQGWCKWAGEHKAVAYGMILAKVEPWKYAIGACWKKDGKKSYEKDSRLGCGCGKHGKHGRHEGHHGHHRGGCPCDKHHGRDGHGRHHHGRHHRRHRDHDDDDDDHDHPHDRDHDDDDEHRPPMPPQLAILRSVDTEYDQPCFGTGPCPPGPPPPPVRPVLARLFHAMGWFQKPHVMEEHHHHERHFETPEMEMARPEMVTQEEVYV